MERSKALAFVTVACAIVSVVSRPAVARVIFVSNDGPADFRTIQAAIDDANDGDTVLVAPGTYAGDGNRDIDFRGKAITVKSEQGPETCTVDCRNCLDPNGVGAELYRGFHFHSGEDNKSILQGFTITNGRAANHERGGAILCDKSSPQIADCCIVGNGASYGGGIGLQDSAAYVRNCMISGNTAADGGGIRCFSSSGFTGACIFERCVISGNHAVFHPRFGGEGGGIILGGNAHFVNCVIAGNRAGYRGGGICSRMFNHFCQLQNCIIWANERDHGDGHQISTYSCHGIVRVKNTIIQDGEDQVADRPCHVTGQWQSGDPCFAQPGHWSDGDAPYDWTDDAWVEGDYHLKSQTGRWDPNSRTWLQDDVTSPCIDAGDPGSPIGEEPFPNGGRINIGAYGGTAEASKSYFGQPNCLRIVAGDVNGDCRVGFADLALLTDHWLEDRSEYGRVTTTCRFIESRSSIHVTSRVSHSHPVEGEFRLSIDVAAGTASFDQVHATWGAEPGPTGDLNAFFQMTELVSTDVKSTRVEFVFRKNIPRFPCADVELTVTFHQGLVHLSGGYLAPVWDGAEYDLDAMAVPVDDPRSPQSIARMLEMIIAGDVDGNCRVDFADLAVMTSHWKEVGPRAYIK